MTVAIQRRGRHEEDRLPLEPAGQAIVDVLVDPSDVPTLVGTAIGPFCGLYCWVSVMNSYSGLIMVS